jgi:hypothetical protein
MPATTSRPRSSATRWRRLHLGIDAETGRIVASALTSKEADDGAQTSALLDQITDPVASVPAMEPTIRTLFTPPLPSATPTRR